MALVRFDNDGVDYDDGLRLMTEGALTLNGVPCVRVGVYRQRGHVYVREDTVYPERRPGTRSTRAEKLRSAVMAELKRGDFSSANVDFSY